MTKKFDVTVDHVIIVASLENLIQVIWNVKPGDACCDLRVEGFRVHDIFDDEQD